MDLIPFPRLLRLVVILAACSMLTCSTQTWVDASRKGTPEDRLMADIRYLADDRLEGRAFGSRGEIKAGNYIAKRFDLLNLQPKGENGTWFQSFSVKNPSPHGVEFGKSESGSIEGRNVIGYLDHRAP